MRNIELSTFYKGNRVPIVSFSGINDSFNSYLLTLCCNFPELYPIIQSTGMYDKNDKEIYEGDIITLYSIITGVRVYWGNGAWAIRDNNDFNKLGGLLCSHDSDNIEVTGNMNE